MKIVAIMGSPHGVKGSTGLLLGELTKAAQQEGAEVTTMLLARQTVKPCRACDACHRTGVCPIKDNWQKYKQAMHEADGIVLASPNYIFSVSAQLKALMDRCCGPLHCQSLRGKYAAAVVSSGGAESAEVESYLLRFLQSLGCQTVGSVGAAGFELANEPTRSGRLTAAGELGRELVRCIAQKRSFPEQDERREAFFQRMRQLIQMRQADWTYEFNYYKSQGWL